MEAANKIQSYFFPATMPRVPGYELAARSRPATATGGDYYDVIPLCDQRLGLVIGDVCGHGLGPSLLMAAVRATLRSLALRDHTPHGLLTDLNQVMHSDMGYRQRFTTMIYGTLDPARHQFLYANAGHGPLTLHYQAQTGQFHVLPEQEGLRGFPLGITDDGYPACPTVDLAPGDLLILGSDGIIESRRNGELFGMERFRRLLTERLQCPLAQTVDELFARSLAFSGDVQPQDDLTLLLVRRT
jgi:serine phosphatase RsbU (regulator of sigma subunit)